MHKLSASTEEFQSIPESPQPSDSNANDIYGNALNFTAVVRYANILPLERSKVVLNLDVAPSTFFEGNYVNVGAKGTVISASAPTDATLESWYGAIWMHGCTDIFCLTNIEEKGMEKMIPYWPTSSNTVPKRKSLGELRDSAKGSLSFKEKYLPVDAALKVGRYTIRAENPNQLFKKRSDHITKITLSVTKNDDTKYVNLYWYTGWPDFGVPDFGDACFLLKKMKKALDLGNTILTHCSAGCGRTGVMNSCLRIIYTNEHPTKAVENIRNFRANSVQTKEQYSFIKNAISCFQESQTLKSDSIHFVSDLKKSTEICI
jgi:protein tyrosine phosphatase